MEKERGKIGVRGAFFMLLLIIYSPSVRIFPAILSGTAAQAGWLCPLAAGIIFVYYIRQMNILFLSYPGLSLLEIYEKTLGKILAKILAIFYLMYLFIINSYDLKYYGERLVSSIYPNTDNTVFLIIMIVLVAFTMKSGLVIISRMSEFFFWLILLVFIVLSSLLMPNVDLAKLTPLTYKDILPVLQGSGALISIWCYSTYIFMLSDNMKGFEKFKKRGYQCSGILFFFTTVLLITTIGTMGSYILKNSHVPYLITVEPIILLQSATGFDSVLVTTWILSDYAILAIMLFVFLKLIKYIFNLKDASIYINLICILTYFGSKLLATNIYDLVEFSSDMGLKILFVLCFIIPVIISWIHSIKARAKKMIVKSGAQ